MEQVSVAQQLTWRYVTMVLTACTCVACIRGVIKRLVIDYVPGTLRTLSMSRPGMAARACTERNAPLEMHRN